MVLLNIQHEVNLSICANSINIKEIDWTIQGSVHIYTIIESPTKDLATHVKVKTKEGKRKRKEAHDVLDALPWFDH